MTLVKTIIQTLNDKIGVPERTVIIGGKLSNPKSIECQLIKSINSGIIEFLDPTGKTLIHSPFFSELLNEYYSMVQEYFDFLDIVIDSADMGLESPDKQLKELKQTLEKDALQDEVRAFLDEHPEYSALIQKLREFEEYSFIKSLIDKFMKGTPSYKTAELLSKITSKDHLGKLKFVSRFIPMPDISSRTLIVIFNSSSSSVPKTPELISIIKNRNDNVIVVEPSTPKSTFFRITDLYPENFSVLYHTKSKSVFRNFN